MKKLILPILLFLSNFTFANIVIKDIPDFTFSQINSNLRFDFDSDGTNEFEFNIQGQTVFCFFDSSSVNFVGTGTIQSGHGWDVIKYLTIGTVIDANSNFSAAVDSYINPGWAYLNELFPIGDSYIGTTFKIGSNRYYGWILVHSTGSNSGVIAVKSYAYNNIANQQIIAGQTLEKETFSTNIFLVYPNPINDIFTIDSNLNKNDYKIEVSNANGLIIPIIETNNRYNISHLPQGFYYIRIEDIYGNFEVEKIIKN
ncbi:T9SS type A sorting domain-containing protein [Flavobacterium sp. SUN046]|uniref:T9SS type A sorting domain-containing protein n=1 Tax=Flavobacterium sp. SUN046 TaxID=3002440 RepID=UPI002DBEC4B2|nr:T9SS type A sorting domain-containing protein [Flavobacterium sp. SUN046]MEC4050940.1 T9SS type A sorting domain-containing protein [Flavobacterium sp. SUN046]